METTSIIVAVGSPPGRSARGIVRVDGCGALGLVGSVSDLAADAGRGVHRAQLRLDGAALPAIALRFPEGRSYTGNEAAELQLPGNPMLLERVIEQLIARGADAGLDVRRAGPGEFTARAFLNGRISLTRAEGVAATIAARSDAELRAARLLCSGAVERLAREVAADLAELLALVEAGIDFTDQEDVVAIAPDALVEGIAPLREVLASHLERAVGMEQLQAVPWVVLSGAPNAGKSTLFNALLGRTRAVVSPVPGTTRDVLAEPIVVQGAAGPAEVILADLAGADLPRSPLEDRMQRSAQQALERAELIIRCAPLDEPIPAGGGGDLLVRTKADLAPDAADGEALSVSAARGAGLDDLRAAIAERLADRAVSLASDAMALQPRHEAALRSAERNLAEAARLLEHDHGCRDLTAPELIASSLRAALDDLAELAGDITPDDVLGRIFATFCVGK